MKPNTDPRFLSKEEGKQWLCGDDRHGISCPLPCEACAEEGCDPNSIILAESEVTRMKHEHMWRKQNADESLLTAKAFVCEDCGAVGDRKGGRIVERNS